MGAKRSGRVVQAPQPSGLVGAASRYTAVAALSAATVLLATGGAASRRESPPLEQAAPAVVPKPLDRMTAVDLAAMPDDQLSKLDPLVMDLIVARGIPGLEKLDIQKYVAQVDGIAARLDAADRKGEPFAHDDPTYKVSREFWMAGGMAVSLAGPSFGIRYTKEGLDAGKPEQQFVYGLLDTKLGTCATMPVLYMAVGHRLGWPIKAVVSRDHMWARWDDGKPGGQRFNLEATSATSDGSWGSFGSCTDEQYVKDLGTPPIALNSGSDMTSLTARQTLGVFLQGRAANWREAGRLDEAERDMLLAVQCFPQNRDIRAQLVAYMSGVTPRYFTGAELAAMGAQLGHEGTAIQRAGWTLNPPQRRPLGYLSPAETDRINRQNQPPDPLLSHNR